MSLTQAEEVFASIDQAGVNDLLKAFFTARPRYLTYGTPLFVPTTTTSATAIPAVSFPGILGGLEFEVSFAIPSVDINPDDSGGLAPLLPGVGQFAVQTQVKIRVQCGSRRPPKDDRQPGRMSVLSTDMEVYGLCRPLVINLAPGNGEIGIQLEKVEIVDIKPDTLESVIECVLLSVLQSVLANVRIPFNTITAGAFGLALLVGPLAEQDQIKVRGDVL